MKSRLKHVGADAILAERTKLLAQYDTAKLQVTDDPVKADHGNVAEDLFRGYLAGFLPKKYGVTKGHIITRDLTYDDPLEEWDVVVYDQLEAPVLFVRGGGAAVRRGIPARYVKAVIEVKAALTQSSARKVAEKLLKLERFRRTTRDTPRSAGEYRDYLPTDFFSHAVFFETATTSKADYVGCLDKLQPLGVHACVPFLGALILRSQHHPSLSGVITSMMNGEKHPDFLHDDPRFELSHPVPVSLGHGLPDMYGFTVSAGFGANVFADRMMSLVERLNDGADDNSNGPWSDLLGFGHDAAGLDRHRLWPDA